MDERRRDATPTISEGGKQGGWHGVEVLTIDRCQGRDKEVLLISFVRASEAGGVGNLLRDWQRINVALTRPRSKLLLLGSAATLARGVPLLQHMLTWLRERGWVLQLPADALPRAPSLVACE